MVDALLNGAAVTIDLGMAFHSSARLGLCEPGNAGQVGAHLEAVKLASEVEMLNRRFSAARLVAYMRLDKETRDGVLRFVLVRGVGKVVTSGEVLEEATVELLQIREFEV